MKIEFIFRLEAVLFITLGLASMNSGHHFGAIFFFLLAASVRIKD